MRPAVIAAGVCAALVCAGPASAWRFDLHGSVTDGSIINNVASSVAVDPAGDVVVAGCLEEVPVSLDFTVVKLSGGRGREVWRRQIRG